MDVKEYIASGILELYVAGQLSEKENLEVAAMAKEHPAVLSEIEAIENVILSLTKATAPKGALSFKDIQNRLGASKSKVIPLDSPKTSWFTYTGWAASIVLAAGLLWFYNSNQELRSKIENATQENLFLEEQIANANNSLEGTTELLNTIRDRGIDVVSLAGQEISPTSYAKVYWNKQEQKAYIDVQGLPEPPPGMVYQVWSLKLNPLTPTSVGILDNYALDDNKIFALANPNESEAFGITLEPDGGSESPTMEQLYALGVVSS